MIVNQRKFDVDFRQSYLFDDDDNYLDRFEKLLLNRRPAEFICRVTLKDKNGKRTVDSAALEQLIDEWDDLLYVRLDLRRKDSKENR